MAVDPNADGALRADGTNTSISTPTTGCSHSSESGMRAAQGRRWGRRCGQPRAVKAKFLGRKVAAQKLHCPLQPWLGFRLVFAESESWPPPGGAGSVSFA